MRITQVNIPKINEPNKGLEDIYMNRLEQIVLLTGKNGSGKTRIIDKIILSLAGKPGGSALANVNQQVKERRENIKNYEQGLENMADSLKNISDQDAIDRTERKMANNRSTIEGWENQIDQYKAIINWGLLETSETADSYSAQQFVPKNLELFDSNEYAKSSLLKSADAINQVGVSALPAGTLAKIQVIQNKWFSATHPKSELSGEERAQAITKYEELKKLVEMFLDTTIGRSSDDEATIFGFPLGQSRLSEGQKVLLQFCLAIYSQETALRDLILIMDEPENHLHPSVIIETLDRVIKCVPNGQIWIATHSVPVLAHFDPRYIWYVDDGRVSHIGDGAENVLGSLLGDDEEIAKLQDFLGLPAQHSIIKYAHESLLQPHVASTGNDDPQVLQIDSELNSVKEGMLKVLDFGAGKGRLLAGILEAHQPLPSDFAEKFDYYAYDESDEHKESCLSIMKTVYPDYERRYFNDETNIKSDLPSGSFDVIILCNVLHEIDPKIWPEVFDENSIMWNLLSDSGRLLIVEDQLIPTGEKAYQNGFIVLDTPDLKELFSLNKIEHSDFRHDGRLKCHRIPKSAFSSVTSITRTKALRHIESTAKKKIRKIRESEPSYENGRAHAFWSQQLSNSILAQSDLG